VTNTCGSQVTAGNGCNLSVTFTPTVTGADNGTVTISDNAGSGSQTISLTGSGVAAAPVATLSKTSLSFASQIVNTTSAPQTVTLTNTGNTSLSIQSVVPTGDFAASSCPSSLGINGVCTISVTFTPITTGTRNGSITITDNAGGSPQIITLTGTGGSSTAPSITSLSPTSGAVGTAVTIGGSGFGASQSTSTVKFNGTTATPTSWLATSIVAPVPTAATTGSVVVTVGGVASNGVNFTVGARTVFLGDSNIEASEDDNPLGQAQAWPFTASTTGTVSTLWFYADSSSGNGPYLEGIYSDAGGNPGALLASGSTATTAAGKWNSMTLAAPLKVTAGVRYWIALLGVSGNTVHFRDVRFQQTTCTSPGSQTGLTALPAAWITTASWASCPGSVYGSN